MDLNVALRIAREARKPLEDWTLPTEEILLINRAHMVLASQYIAAMDADEMDARRWGHLLDGPPLSGQMAAGIGENDA